MDYIHSLRFHLFLLIVPFTIISSVASHTIPDDRKIERRQNALTGVPSTSEFISRAYHATGQLGNYLYIDGGEIAFASGGSQINLPGTINTYHSKNVQNIVLAADFEQDNQTYSIDLTQEWTNSTIQFTAIDKNNAPVLNYVQLWTDKIKGVAYAYGGEQSFQLPIGGSRQLPPNTLWKFVPDNKGSGTWSLVSNTNDFDGIHRVGAAYYATGAHVGIMLGGYTSVATSLEDNENIVSGFVPSPGLAMFNYTSMTWSNRSATGFTQYGTAQYGQAHVVSGFGNNKVFAFFGGESSNQTAWTDNGSNLLSFETIYLYDPFADKWFSQNTSGTAPNPRDRFCSVGLPGDNGTYEMFMFGGHVAPNDGSISFASDTDSLKETNNAMDQVFVLSLPGFVWHKADYPPRSSRIEHSCEVAGNRQMIVVGGRNPATNDLQSFTFTPDPWPNGIGVFDLTAMQWSDKYDPNAAEYTTPQAVKDWYSQNGRFPSAWNNEDVKNYFETKGTISDDDRPQGANKTSSSSGSGNSQQQSSKSSSTNVGAIAGGVVGGVAGLALIGLAVWFLLRHRNKNNASHPPKGTSEMSAYGYSQRKEQFYSGSEEGFNKARHESAFQELMATEQRPEMPGTVSQQQTPFVRHEMPS